METLAAVLAAEDTRRFDGPLLRAATRHPSPIVRRHAALAIGRIQDAAGLDPLLEIISDPDTLVQRAALFSLGLLGDTRAVAALRQLVLDPTPALQGVVHGEAAAAVARIGGPESASVFRELLSRWLGAVGHEHPPTTLVRALGEAWRLGAEAPVEEISQFADSRSPDVRWRAVYSLAQLRAPQAAGTLIRATEDSDPLVRSLAVQALTAGFAERAKLDPGALAVRVRRLVHDENPHVRINALRALATYGGREYVSVVADRAADRDPNVRVEALLALGRMEGEDAARTLAGQLDGGLYATRRAALIGLARVAGAAALPKVKDWTAASDWRRRATAAEASGFITHPAARDQLARLLHDGDGRVVAAALRSLLGLMPAGGDSLARVFALHEDEAVHSIAVQHLAEHPDSSQVSVLVQAYDLALHDRGPDARIQIVRALGKIAQRDLASRSLVEERFLSRFPACDDYLVRRAAEQGFPAAAQRWGPSRPVASGKGIADYREIAREWLLPAARGEIRPALVIELDRGELVIDLFPADAPLTIRALLDLVDRRFFDGTEWHRVVPNFVVQAGDPRGDGWGGPGFAIRDELSPQPYDRGTMGMALSGPDTGGSQFFITHSPQPHLEGTYPVLGSVGVGLEVLDRITQGDRIRRIRRR